MPFPAGVEIDIDHDKLLIIILITIIMLEKQSRTDPFVGITIGRRREGWWGGVV